MKQDERTDSEVFDQLREAGYAGELSLSALISAVGTSMDFTLQGYFSGGKKHWASAVRPKNRMALFSNAQTPEGAVAKLLLRKINGESMAIETQPQIGACSTD